MSVPRSALSQVPVLDFNQDKVPVLDGKLGDAAYKNALKCSPFLSFPAAQERRVAKEQTTAWILIGPRNLFLATRCEMKDGRKPRAVMKKRDSAVWSDDCIEFFLDDSLKTLI